MLSLGRLFLTYRQEEITGDNEFIGKSESAASH